MRTRIIMQWAIVAAAFSGAAIAGTFTPIGETGGSYGFTGCTRPAEPVLTVEAALKGAERRAAQNAAVSEYNVYVRAVNAYLECIGGEAERDLMTYYTVVSGALDSEQTAILGRVEEMRAALK